jgi:uracil-DNA glycosylase
VLLLNTCLTVRRSEANSHQKQGWETLTDAIVREVARKQGIVYLLWGKPAQTK